MPRRRSRRSRSHRRPLIPVPPNDMHNYFFGFVGFNYTMHNPHSTVQFAGTHNYTVHEAQEVLDYFNMHRPD